MVNDFRYDPFLLCTEKRGELWKGEILYRIDILNNDIGFFAMFKAALMHMYFAESLHLLPVVNVGKESPYYEEEGVDGITNPWEYYFCQYKDVKLDDCESAYRVVKNKEILFSKGLREVPDIDTYDLSDFAISELSRVCRKYIKLKPNIEAQIFNDMNNMGMSGKILGVHIRGGDMQINYSHHPIAPLVFQYIDAVKDAISKDEYDMIFLATDDQNMLETFCKEINMKIVFYKDVVRVKDKIPPYKMKSNRKNNNFMCGYEVLRDMVSLSCCDSLVCGLSQVSIAARIFKKAKQDNYLLCNIIKIGINK